MIYKKTKYSVPNATYCAQISSNMKQLYLKVGILSEENFCLYIPSLHCPSGTREKRLKVINFTSAMSFPDAFEICVKHLAIHSINYGSSI
jgi:hypothetical protein